MLQIYSLLNRFTLQLDAIVFPKSSSHLLLPLITELLFCILITVISIAIINQGPLFFMNTGAKIRALTKKKTSHAY